MHQIGSGMYVSGPVPDRKKDRHLGSAATPPYTGGDPKRSGELGRMFDIAASQSQAPSPASSSRRSSGPLHRPSPASGPLHRPSPASGPLSQLSSNPGLLVGPSPSPSPLPAFNASSSSSKGSSSRRSAAGKDAEAASAVVRGKVSLGVSFAWYVAAAVVAAAALGAGAYCLVSWRRWEALAAAGVAAALVAAPFVWNACRKSVEAERFLRGFPDTAFDQGDMPVGEIVKITGQVTCGRQPLGVYFHDAARCVFTSVQLFERRGCCRRWQLRHSEERVTNFYISDRNSGKRFFVRTGDGAKITPMFKRRTMDIGGDTTKGASRQLKNWMTSNDLSTTDGNVRVKEGFIREGESASVIGVLRKQHAYDIVDAPSGVISTGCQLTRFTFPILVEGLILIGSEDPDEAVYVV